MTFKQRFDRIDRELKAIRVLVSKVAEQNKRTAPRKGEKAIAQRKKQPKRPA